MIRILFVSTSTTLGGAERTLFSLATKLDPGRFQTAGVVSLKSSGYYAKKLQALNIKTVSLGINHPPTLKDARALAKIIHDEKPDIVHALMYQAIQMCRFAKRRAGVPFRLISSPRVSYRTRSGWTLLVDRLLKKFDNLLIAESQATRQFLISKLGYAPHRVATIYNGVDLQGWSMSELQRKQKRLEMRLHPGEILIGTVGRLDKQKGHGILVEALARLSKERPIRCAILGEGPMRGKLEAQIRGFGLEQNITLLGERDDAASWLSALDLFVLPSLWEGLPNALLEAMALGLPVIASQVDGIPEVISHNETGLMVPPNDATALAKAIEKLMDDPSKRASLGSAAQNHIRGHFSLTDMLSHYEAAYQRVLSH